MRASRRMSVYASGATGFKYTFTLNDGETPGNCALINDETGRGWRLKFFESGIFTPAKNVNVDVFLVGGGGAGYVSANGSVVSGGGGGCTRTHFGVSLVGGDSYSVVVGDGGIAVSGTTVQNKLMRKGGRSGFGLLADVAGGEGGQNYRVGGSGGSGGAGCSSSVGSVSAQGGSDGGNGEDGGGTGGTGQGTTTAEFGEEHGYLYAGGGAGGVVNKYVFQGGYGGLPTLVDGVWVYTEYSGGATGESAAPNTGGGGGGSKTEGQGAGGSGIVIIRNAR